MTTKVYNQDGKEVGTVELNAEVFGIEPNEFVVHQYITNYRASQRQGTHQTKTRKEVSGGGKKPWKQKGTGRARAGTIRSPLWRGGGTVFGPHPREYGSAFPKKMKRLAICSVLSSKAKSDSIRVIDKFDLSEIKTKSVATLVNKLQAAGKKCILLDEGINQKLVLSCRNMDKLHYRRAAIVNGYELLDAEVLLITKAGLAKVEETFA
jgi:large subunit ribosomal protein L4